MEEGNIKNADNPMELNFLISLFSNNEEQRNSAREFVLTSMKNPKFLDFLITSLNFIIKKQPSEENLILVRNICIIVHEEFKTNAENINFFSKEQVYFAFTTLFSILFNIPVQIRQSIINTFEIFFSRYKNLFSYVELVKQCLTILQQSSSIIDKTTAIKMVFLWSSRQAKVKMDQERFDHEEFARNTLIILPSLLNQSLEFLRSIPQEFHQYIENSQNPQFSTFFGNDENALKNVRDKLCLIEMEIQFIEYSAILTDALIGLNGLFSKEFSEIIKILSQFLCVEIPSSNSMVQMKKEICNLLVKIKYLFGSKRKLSETKNSFAQYFAADVSPILVQSLLQSFRTSKNSTEIMYSLSVVRIYLMDNIFSDVFLSDNFIQQILIPVSCLTTEDLQSFKEIPEQYLEFCMIFTINDSLEAKTIRQNISLIISSLKEPVIQRLMGFLCTPSSSEIEAEVKIFLKTVVVLYHKIHVSFILETMNEINQAIQSRQKKFHYYYYASLLAFLSAQEPNDDAHAQIADNINQNCINLAVFSLLNIESEVIQIAACELLNSCFDTKFIMNVKNGLYPNIESAIQLPQIIQKIFNLASKVQHKMIGIILGKLFETFSKFFSQVSLDIIGQFYLIWEKECNELYDESKAILLSISKFINELPKNGEMICQLMIMFTPKILNDLQNNTYKSSYKQLIDILGVLSSKIDLPPPPFFISILEFIKSVGFNEQYFESIKKCSNVSDDEDEETANSLYNPVSLYIGDYVVVMCSLICKKNFFTIPNSVNYIVFIINALLSYNINAEFVSNAFLISTCLLQSASVSAPNVLESLGVVIMPAIQFLRTFHERQNKSNENDDDEEDYFEGKFNTYMFISAVTVVSTALIINEAGTIGLLDPIVLNNWINNHNLMKNAPSISFIHWSAIALLNLSKYNLNNQGALLFVKAVNEFVLTKTLENDDDYNNLENEEFDTLQVNIESFPFDDLKCDQLFNGINQNDQRLQFLTKEQLDLFAYHVHKGD